MYFVKWLPVEGEIRSGDKFTWDKEIHTAASIPEESMWGPSVLTINGRNLVINKEDKKVKMFLCSRDIQVGDKIYSKNYQQEGIVSEFKDNSNELFWLQGEELIGNAIPRHHIDNWGKVIGEISPDAVPFLEEGQELGEEQVRNKGEKLMINPFAKMPVNVFMDIYEVKCPWGHFH